MAFLAAATGPASAGFVTDLVSLDPAAADWVPFEFTVVIDVAAVATDTEGIP